MINFFTCFAELIIVSITFTNLRFISLLILLSSFFTTCSYVIFFSY